MTHMFVLGFFGYVTVCIPCNYTWTIHIYIDEKYLFHGLRWLRVQGYGNLRPVLPFTSQALNPQNPTALNPKTRKP